MAIIIPYSSQSSINNAGSGQIAPYRSASAFTIPGQTNMPGALEHFSGGLDKLNDAAFKMQLDKQRVRNATEMLADETAYKGALRDFDREYKNTRKGADALTAEEDYNDFHREQFEKLQEKWSGTPHLMPAVAAMAENIRKFSLNKAAAYRDQQEEEHKAAVYKAAEDSLAVLWADPGADMQEKRAALKRQITSLRLLSGQYPETWKAGFMRWEGGNEEEAKVKINQLVQTLHNEHVQSLMYADRYAEAEKFTREHMREFGDKANDTLALVEARREAWGKKQEVEREKADTENLFNKTMDMSDEEAMAYIFGNDTKASFESRKDAFNMRKTQISMRDYQRDLQEKKANDNAYAELKKIADNRDTHDDPKAYLNVTRALPLDKWATFAKITERLQGEDYVKTNPDAYSEVLRRISQGEKLISVAAEYGDRLSLADIDVLQDPDKAKALAKMKGIFDEKAKDWAVEPGKGNALFLDIQQYMPPEGFKTNEEYEKFMGERLRKLVVDKNWAFEKPIRQYEAGEYALKGYYPVIGEAEREVLETELKKRGYPVNPKNLLTLWREVTGADKRSRYIEKPEDMSGGGD
ncbi:MAG: hypothetical protein LBM00_02695 [Deltaproteobacteria bacterium]|jgi:hypothetical protein|nr:hypothetical protein [Deltaproteobacteria bacterium]